ncbi:MAG: ABC transporter ATP-binding protein [Clostridiales bacterium]|nr:ABC transporter ATP-binding protein [Clostridiales bacterium]
MRENAPIPEANETLRQKRRKRYAAYRQRRASEERPADFKGTLKKLLSLLVPHKFKLILVLVTAIVSTVLSVIGPAMLGDIIDEIENQVQTKLSGGNMSFTGIFSIIGTLFLIYGASSILAYIQSYTMAGITQKVVCRMREDVNKKISGLPLSFFDSHAKGDILSRIMNDIDNISNTLQHNLTAIITSVITIVGVFAIMIYKNATMTAITVSVVPLSAFIALSIAKRSRKLFKEQWDRMGELNGHVEEMYTGHKIVRIFNREQDAIDEFNDINSELYKVSSKAQFISGMIMPFISFVNNVGYVLVCMVGGIFVLRGQFTLGGITTFITYSKLFTQPMVDIAQITNNIQSSFASAERVFSLLAEEEEPPQGNEKTEPLGSVEFRNVSFSYSPDKPLIENMNLTVKPGQLIAIVGPTGAGKTTFVNLLMRFYDVNSGSIIVDNADIRSVNREELRRKFGMVLQDTWLFEGTIRDNIAYGRENATDEEIVEAAKAARVHHYINTLSDGYNTMLDENGTNLSQGQRQLLTIARALLADPEILILDEATSSVDTRTEVQIQQAMSALMNGRTNFVIAHRLSTIRKADEILFIENGTIVERGTHDQLLAKGGHYSVMYNSQFGIA